MDKILDGETLSLSYVEDICFQNSKIALSSLALTKVKESYDYLQNLLTTDKVVYGINTGFGKLSSTKIEKNLLEDLQTNLIRSHAVGLGDPLPYEVAKATMVIRLNSLLKGASGIKLDTINLLAELINFNVYPTIPSIGSLGASGDLAPLAHLALVLMGEGYCNIRAQKISALEVLNSLSLTPIKLGAKEGLALINGTSVSTAMLSVLLIQIKRIIAATFAACTLSLEAFEGCMDAFSGLIHSMKPQAGQRVSAQILQDNLTDSKLVNSSGRVQDPYSFRCIPQVLGPVLDIFEYAKAINQLEMNSATDNPLIFPDDNQILSGGNFHAQPISLCADYLAIALQTVGEMSERRVNQFLDANLSGNLPAFLIDQPGLKSGFMIVQYTDAALVSRNKILCYPASATSIPVSANQEDLVSQAPNSCAKLSEIVSHLAKIIAIEMLTAAQAIEFREAGKLGKTGKKIYEKIRSISKPLTEDRSLQNDIEDLSHLILLGSFQKELPFDVTL